MINTLGNIIKKLSWMEEKTKKKALLKLKTMNFKIGYPNKWSDYNGLENRNKITGRLLCTNIHYISRFHNYSSSDVREKIYEAEKYKRDTEDFNKKEAIV